MFIVGLQGSPRRKGNTNYLLSIFLQEAARLDPALLEDLEYENLSSQIDRIDQLREAIRALIAAGGS